MKSKLTKYHTLLTLTGVLGSSFPPPIKLPFWKLNGYTCFPNLWFRSLSHAMFFLLTLNFPVPRVNVYVSLNKLHAISPQGTIGRPLLDSSGLQELVSLYFSPCKSCWSLLLLTYLQNFEELFRQSYTMLKQQLRLFKTKNSIDTKPKKQLNFKAIM